MLNYAPLSSSEYLYYPHGTFIAGTNSLWPLEYWLVFLFNAILSSISIHLGYRLVSLFIGILASISIYWNIG